MVEWDYREAAAAGTALIALVSGLITGSFRGASVALTDETIRTAAFIGGVVSLALTPLYVSQPRSAGMLFRQTGKQIGLACLVLVGLGALGVPGTPAVTPVFVSGGILLLALPAWYQVCRRYETPQRVLVVGDDPVLITLAVQSLPVRPLGFLSPILTERAFDPAQPGRAVPDNGDPVVVTDGGIVAGRRIDRLAGVGRLGNLSRLECELRKKDVDTVVLAFARGDREECFGALRTCRAYGVDAIVHESLTDEVLMGERLSDELVRVDLEPWPWYSRVAKRVFDVAFATVSILVLTPLILVVSVAVKLDSPGPVLYNQTRSSELGGTFTVAKFRSMVTDAEENGAQLSEEDAGGVDPRVTQVGRILRKTHMDEIPQLFSILTGEMSVVGPRPERPEFDRKIAADGINWSKRWFVKPGLTGIAQINDVTGFEPETKLVYDLEYVRRQSLWLDVNIVVVQISSVIGSVVDVILSQLSDAIGEKSSTRQ